MINKTQIPRGQEVFIGPGVKGKGCLWKGIYQVETTVFWKIKSVVFGVNEWHEIVNRCQIIEMVKGDELLRWILTERAREKGKITQTPIGPRFAIPLDAWSPPEDRQMALQLAAPQEGL